MKNREEKREEKREKRRGGTSAFALVSVNGAQGEGGGQVLRTALSLSLVTGRPFRITNIRAGRKKPGLLRQHLTAVRAATAVGKATVEGAEMRSRELSFRPAGVEAGDYCFAVGTAGSATLILQTLLPPLLVADGPTTLALEGGTHNPWAPPFDFLQKTFLPLINRMGPHVEASLERHGFYPAGGGRFHVRVTPCERLEAFDLLERGPNRERRVRAVIASLPPHIAERELKAVAKRMDVPEACRVIETVDDSRGPGNVVMIELASDVVTEIFTGFGERGVRAEAVAERTAKVARSYIAADAPVGPHLADQLLILLAMAGGGSFRTVAPTRHTLTNVDVVRLFLDLPIVVEEEEGHVWRVRVGPAPASPGDAEKE